MLDHINRRTAGATYFFTIRLSDHSANLLVQEIDQLRRAMRETIARHPFRIDAICVLPSVLHTIWTLPPDDHRYPTRVAMLKSRFSRAMPMPEHRTLAQIKRAEKGIWQRSYWEHQICDDADLARHRDMIYLSPVQAGLCAAPQDWQHSSLHRDMSYGAAEPMPLGDGAVARSLTRSQPTSARVGAVGLSLLER